MHIPSLWFAFSRAVLLPLGTGKTHQTMTSGALSIGVRSCAVQARGGLHRELSWLGPQRLESAHSPASKLFHERGLPHRPFCCGSRRLVDRGRAAASFPRIAEAGEKLVSSYPPTIQDRDLCRLRKAPTLPAGALMGWLSSRRKMLESSRLGCISRPRKKRPAFLRARSATTGGPSAHEKE